ncbi:GTP cyclohydrolase I [Spirillospora sp. NPDC048819]|uniref:GTP cyclohydrolase I n=1 Tax=Spirillospora sp. NPDC048819 TaxID=3155268 RepID=UPI0033DD3434
MLLSWFGEVFGRESDDHAILADGIKEDPERISRAYRDLLSGGSTDPLTLLKPVKQLAEGESHGLVQVGDIPFVSMCAHHFLPFFGTATVAYHPRSVIIGIGKIPRMVDCLARRFQLQETLTELIVDTLFRGADAEGAWARLSAQHLCMSHRGPTAVTAVTTTSHGLGVLAGRTAP